MPFPPVCHSWRDSSNEFGANLSVIHAGVADTCARGVAFSAFDFDGMQKYPPELRSSKDFPKLTAALQKRGYSDADIYRIMYQNLRDYIVQFV